MANSPQATKRARQDVFRRAVNVGHRTKFRTFQKNVAKAIDAKDYDAAKLALGSFVSVADVAAGRGIVHPNKAARIKRRLYAALKKINPQTG